jgi:hypothetical protein
LDSSEASSSFFAKKEPKNLVLLGIKLAQRARQPAKVFAYFSKRSASLVSPGSSVHPPAGGKRQKMGFDAAIRAV